jgi:hypothetical protein
MGAWSIAKEVATIIPAAMGYDLRQAYEIMRKDGDRIAEEYLYNRELLNLLREVESKEPSKAKGYMNALQRSLPALQRAIYDARNHGMDDRGVQPGHFAAIRRGFEKIDPVVLQALKPDTPPELVVLAGEKMLELMAQLFIDYQKVLGEALGNKPDSAEKKKE